MPSSIPSYVYSLFAALIVGTIVVSACSMSMANLKHEAERQQLSNIDRYVATQGLTLIADATGNNQNTTKFLNIPNQIGNQRYWLSLTNDSSGTWVESGFGDAVNPSQYRFSIPAQITASGVLISGSGRAFLQCYSVNQTITLTLINE